MRYISLAVQLTSVSYRLIRRPAMTKRTYSWQEAAAEADETLSAEEEHLTKAFERLNRIDFDDYAELDHEASARFERTINVLHAALVILDL